MVREAADGGVRSAMFVLMGMVMLVFGTVAGVRLLALGLRGNRDPRDPGQLTLWTLFLVGMGGAAGLFTLRHVELSSWVVTAAFGAAAIACAVAIEVLERRRRRPPRTGYFARLFWAENTWDR